MYPDPHQWGVERTYWDVMHNERHAPDETVAAILRSMGAVTESPDAALSGPLVLTAGETPAVDGEWHVALEDGGNRYGSANLPGDLPLGYHRLITHAGDRMLVVAPPACPSYDGVRRWGWAAQLYSLRSKASWGIGDLGDLRRFGDLSARHGGGFTLVNPLHAAIPGVPQQTSPYFPSSREFRNPLYIDVTAVRGFSPDLLTHEQHRSIEALQITRIIDRDTVWELKIEVLESLWAGFDKGDPEFSEYIEREGVSLHRYATYCVLREHHGLPWTAWPASFRHPSSAVVEVFAREQSDRIAFYMWLQWLLSVQVHAASKTTDMITDLAIGVDPAGADAWIWQDAFALDMRVGAPPDEFNQRGQDWGLPPFDPWRLRALDYEPFVRTIRAAVSSSMGVRIDHVMGLFRLYWIPDGATAREGTYVRYPWRDLLNILCLESVRADALVVGEDLGTVEQFMRDELAQRCIASYRLFWFEEAWPDHYPAQSLAALTTHDLPTVAGLWSGSDLEVQERLGMQPNYASTDGIRHRVQHMIELPDEADDGAVADACHRVLATAASALVTATLEDALRLPERPNYPGTTTEWPNWSVALPVLLDDLEADDGFQATCRVMGDARPFMSYHDAHEDPEE